MAQMIENKVGSPIQIEIFKEAGLRVPLIQKELLEMEGLADHHKSRLEDLFSGNVEPTDGDTFITFQSPLGGYLTIDQLSGGDLTVAWHEMTRFERGKVEAVRVSFENAMYKEYEKVPPGAHASPDGIFKIGNDALSSIDSFRARRLQGENA